MQGIIYVRVSSAEQVSGTSLTSQEADCRRYCASQHIHVLEVFREEGESAKTADRTALLRALDYCRKHKGAVKAFVVAKVDRFARNTEDHFYVRKLLLDNGVTLHSVSEPIGNRPTEKFVETVLAAGAEFDNAIRKQRCTDGLIGRINQGIWPLRPPVGYLCARHRKHGEKKTRPDDIDSHIFPIIQRGLKAYHSGGVRSLRALADYLDAQGLAALRGRSTRLQLVDKLLGTYLNFYSGILVNPWTGVRQPGRHFPMITELEAERIRLIRRGRLKPWAAKKDRFNPEFPLRQSVLCASCSRRLTGGYSRGRNKSYPYYFCCNAGCAEYGKAIARARLHEHFDELLSSVLLRPFAYSVVRESVKDVVERVNGALTEGHGRTNDQLTVLEARRRQIFEMREDGTYTTEMFRERMDSIDSQIVAVRSELRADCLPDIDIDAAFTALERFCHNLRDHWHDLPPRARARFELAVFPVGITYDRQGGVRTAELAPVFTFAGNDTLPDSSNVHFRRDSLNQMLESLAEITTLDKELQELLSGSGLTHSTTVAGAAKN